MNGLWRIFQRKCPCISLITSDFSVTSIIYGRNKVTFCRFCLLCKCLWINSKLRAQSQKQGYDYQQSNHSVGCFGIETSVYDESTNKNNQLWITERIRDEMCIWNGICHSWPHPFSARALSHTTHFELACSSVVIWSVSIDRLTIRPRIAVRYGSSIHWKSGASPSTYFQMQMH